MINAVAIDDEPKALDIIKHYCDACQDVVLVKTFTEPQLGLDYILNHQNIQVAFLDIRMAKLSGLDLARQLPSSVRVILTTAFSDYAALAFELDAIDYLMKPFSQERFLRAVEKLRNVLEPVLKSDSIIKKLLPRQDDIMLIRADHKIIKLRLNELVYLEGAGNYVAFYTLRGKVLVLNTLKALERQLAPYQFLRIHKSFIISFLFLDEVEKNAVTVNGIKLAMSEGYKESLEKFLMTYSQQPG